MSINRYKIIVRFTVRDPVGGYSTEHRLFVLDHFTGLDAKLRVETYIGERHGMHGVVSSLTVLDIRAAPEESVLETSEGMLAPVACSSTGSVL